MISDSLLSALKPSHWVLCVAESYPAIINPSFTHHPSFP
jgi:hypothetical protein